MADTIAATAVHWVPGMLGVSGGCGLMSGHDTAVIVAARLTEPEAIIAPAAGVYAATSKPILTLAHRERLPQKQAAMSLHYCSV